MNEIQCSAERKNWQIMNEVDRKTQKQCHYKK